MSERGPASERSFWAYIVLIGAMLVGAEVLLGDETKFYIQN